MQLVEVVESPPWQPRQFDLTVDQKQPSPADESPGLRLRLREPPSVVGLAAPGAFDCVFNGFLFEPAAALEVALERLAKAEQSGDAKSKAAALLAVADATVSMEKHEEAMQKTTEAVGLFKDLGDAEGEAAGFHVLAKAHFVKGDNDKALQINQKALGLFRALGHRTGEAATLNSLAEVHLTKDSAEALRCALEGQELFRQLGDRRRAALLERTAIGAHLARGDSAEAVMLQDIAQAELRRKRPTKALDVATDALRLYQECGDTQRVKDMSDIIDYAEYMQHKMKVAVEEAEMMMNDFKRTGDTNSLYKAALRVYEARRKIRV